MKIVFSLYLILGVTLLGAEPLLRPASELIATGNVVSLERHGERLFAATDSGVVDFFDLKENRHLQSLKLPPIKSFFEDSYPPKIFGIDTLDGQTLLILSEDSDGGRALFLYQNEKLEKLFSTKDQLSIKEARFITPNTLLLALTSNEIALFELSGRRFLYRTQLSLSTFSDLALSETRGRLAATNESGEIDIVDSQNGSILKKLKGIHKDNVYQLAMAKETILSAGQDRRVGIFSLSRGSAESLEGGFLIYAVGISPKGERGAYMKNEESDIALFEIRTKAPIATLKGHQATLNTLLFIDEKELVSGADERRILRWRLP